jgi:integrase
MYAQAADDDLIPVNPTGVRVNMQPAEIDPDDDAEDRRALTADELVRVLNGAGDRDRLLLDTLAELGVRWGEVCELRGKDLHREDRPVLRIRRAYSVKTGKVKPTKSGYGRRDLPLSPGLARRLWRLQRVPGELLFTSPLGRRMSYGNTYRRVLGPTLVRASGEGETSDLTWAGFHTFRHTCASLLFAQGRNIRQVQEWLGHHGPGFTLRTYVHLLEDGIGGPLVLPTGGTEGAPKQPGTTRNDTDAAAAESAG